MDLNWLLASVESAERGQVQLLVNPNEIEIALRKHLAKLHESALLDSKECLYIREAREARKKFFIGFFKFQYDESRKYTAMDEGFHFLISDRELDDLEENFNDNSISKMTLFFGLTATAALAEDIRRFG